MCFSNRFLYFRRRLILKRIQSQAARGQPDLRSQEGQDLELVRQRERKRLERGPYFGINPQHLCRRLQTGILRRAIELPLVSPQSTLPDLLHLS